MDKKRRRYNKALQEDSSSRETTVDKKRRNKASLKVFEEALSSRETTPDPYSDDGEYGSDIDYDPGSRSTYESDDSTMSIFDVQTKKGERRQEEEVMMKSSDFENHDESNSSENSDGSVSSDSIFDTRLAKRPRNDTDEDADANTLSMSPSPPPEEMQSSLAPAASPSVDMENSILSSSPPPVDMEDNPAPAASPPPVDMEDNPIPGMSPPPVDMEDNPASAALPPPVDMEDNPIPGMSPPPVDMEDNPAPAALPPPVDMEDNPIPGMSPPPVDMEDNPAPAALPPPVDMENNPIHAASPPPGDMEDNPIPAASMLSVEIEDNPVPRPSRRRTRDSRPTGSRRRPTHQTPSPVENWETSTADIPIFDFDDSSAGVQFELGPNTSVMDIFNKMFPPHIVDYIVTSTNAYGRALCSTNRPTTRNSRRYRYKDVNREEILQFLGLCLLMGQLNIPVKRKLFTYTDPLYFHPIFQYTMSGRRFEQILRCLYVSHLGAKGKDKIMKFIDAVTKNFRECYKPTKELSLDESMLLFRGRLSFRQYIKSKKARYGIKFYELTSSDGYALNLEMYTGKEDDDENERGKKTEKVVMRLMRPYLLKGHWLFMDNYYNSVTLSQKLLDLKTHTAGTLRTNRKDNPKDLKNKKLKKGQHFWVRKNKVYVSKWQDKRSVLMVTTLNSPKLIEITNRRGQKRLKPQEVTIYNKFMSGIDRVDQMISYYSCPRKTLRWYKKVFFHLLDLSVWNSFYIYKKYCKNNCRYDFLTFREELIKDLIKLHSSIKPAMLLNKNRFDNRLKERNEFPISARGENIVNFGHWPEKIPVRLNSKKTTNYMKCKMCSKKKIRRETSLRCKGCEDKPALCAVCFEEWHSQS